jgi:hypothetical protein
VTAQEATSTDTQRMAATFGIREHIMWRGLVVLSLASPCLVWATLPPDNGGADLAWLPPAVGTTCAGAASLTRWWATRIPLFVATSAGVVVTGILAVPDDGSAG